MTITIMLYFTILLYFNLSLIFCFPSGESESDKFVNKDLDANATKIYEQLKDLDKELTQLYKVPEDGKDEHMLHLSQTFNKLSTEFLAMCDTNLKDKKTVLKAARAMLDHGGPDFMDVDVDEEEIKEAFKWGQTKMNKLSMLRLKTGEIWFDLWNMYKNIPDYDP